MGLDLSQFATGVQDIKPSEGGFVRPDDDTYEYEVAAVGVHKGPKGPSAIIDYKLGNGQSYREWFNLPAVFGQETPKERQSIGRYLNRLVQLGVPEAEVNTFSDTDSLVGWRGVFDLVTTKRDGKEYQNVRNMRQGARIEEPLAMTPANTVPATAASVAAPAAAASDDENPFGE